MKEEGRGEDCLKKMKSNMGEREEYFRPPHSHACLGFAWMALADIPKSRLISLGLNSECSRYTVEFQNFRQRLTVLSVIKSPRKVPYNSI